MWSRTPSARTCSIGSGLLVKSMDKTASVASTAKSNAELEITGSVSAPTSGVVLGVRVKVGMMAMISDPALALSATRIETVVAALVSRNIKVLHANVSDSMLGGYLIFEIDTLGVVEILSRCNHVLGEQMCAADGKAVPTKMSTNHEP